VQNIPSSLTRREKDECAVRLASMLAVMAGADGESYARQLQILFQHLEPKLSTEANGVLEHSVDVVLSHITSMS
jgi:hypothetical protein